MLPYEQDWYPHALASPASTPSCAPMSKPGFPLTSKPRKLLLFYSGPNIGRRVVVDRRAFRVEQ